MWRLVVLVGSKGKGADLLGTRPISAEVVQCGIPFCLCFGWGEGGYRA